MFLDFNFKPIEIVKIGLKIIIIASIFILTTMTLMFILKNNHQSETSKFHNQIVMSNIIGIIIDLDYDTGVLFDRPISIMITSEKDFEHNKLIILKPVGSKYKFTLK